MPGRWWEDVRSKKSQKYLIFLLTISNIFDIISVEIERGGSKKDADVVDN